MIGIVHMHHIQILVPGHLPGCHCSWSVYQKVEAAIVVPTQQSINLHFLSLGLRGVNRQGN